MSLRSLPVPDGLAGERVDAGLSRLLGLSRTRAAELAAGGAVRLDGREVGKSDRLVPGGWLEVDVPDAAPAVEVVAEPVPGMGLVRAADGRGGGGPAGGAARAPAARGGRRGTPPTRARRRR